MGFGASPANPAAITSTAGAGLRAAGTTTGALSGLADVVDTANLALLDGPVAPAAAGAGAGLAINFDGITGTLVEEASEELIQ